MRGIGAKDIVGELNGDITGGVVALLLLGSVVAIVLDAGVDAGAIENMSIVSNTLSLTELISPPTCWLLLSSPPNVAQSSSKAAVVSSCILSWCGASCFPVSECSVLP